MRMMLHPKGLPEETGGHNATIEITVEDICFVTVSRHGEQEGDERVCMMTREELGRLVRMIEVALGGLQ